VTQPAAPASPEVDADLLRRAQAGDESAFGCLMKAHYERTFRLVYAVVNHEADARDVCQEVWVTVWRQLAGFRGDAKFTTWLHPIAVRRAVDHLRRRRRWYERFLPFSVGDAEVESVPEPADPVDFREAAEASETVARVRAAIATLPPKHRAVLALREVEGLSYEEIAATVGVPVGTVMSRLYHARRLLVRKLGDSI
jgi:RNA polymerase sigma-70 factor (ECF subfamily)